MLTLTRAWSASGISGVVVVGVGVVVVGGVVVGVVVGFVVSSKTQAIAIKTGVTSNKLLVNT